MKKGQFMRFVFLTIAAAAVLLSLKTVPVPKFWFKQNTVTLEAGSSFCSADYLVTAKDLPVQKVRTTGTVDASVPGNYRLSYCYRKQKSVLTIRVVDTVSPAVTAKPNLSFVAGATIFPEQLVSVTDATACTLKADFSGEDLSVPGSHTVSVIATDRAENSTMLTVKFEISVPDTVPPVIGGAKNKTVTLGSLFDVQKGITVRDDSDPNPKLEIDDSTLDTATVGEYTVLYTATDLSGNQTVVKRIITVVPPPPPPFQYTPPGGTFGWNAAGERNQPYLVAVNRAACTVTVYQKDAAGNYTVPIKAIACSVGRSGHATPTGRFNTSSRYEWLLMVGDCYARYAIRINGPILFHSVCYYTKNKSDLEYKEYNKLGSPASLGCVRMSLVDVKWLYDNCPKGFPVVIYDDPALSGPLGKPESIRIDVNDVTKRGWDPTDWDPKSPWNG